MNKEKRRPAWSQLWLLLPLLAVLATVEVRVPLSPTGHQLVEVAIVLVVFGLAALWIRVNAAAMVRAIDDDLAQRCGTSFAALPRDDETTGGSNGDGRLWFEWTVVHSPSQPAASSGRDLEAQDA